MKSILYPTRGGPLSYPNQDMAIEIAIGRQARLVFLYVSNVRFLDALWHPAAIETVENELDEMGEFLLVMAQERALAAGWKADAIVRHGDFLQAVMEVVKAEGIDTVILGMPGGTQSLTNIQVLENIKKTLEEELNIEVVILGGTES